MLALVHWSRGARAPAARSYLGPSGGRRSPPEGGPDSFSWSKPALRQRVRLAQMVALEARPPWMFDGALAAGLAFLGALEAAVYVELPVEAVVLAEVAVVPVAFRRVAPIPAALGVAGVLLVASGLNGWPDTFSVFAALLA